MPNDMMSKILELMGINSYTGRPMQRRGRGDTGMDRYTQDEAFMPGDPMINQFDNTSDGPPTPQQTGAQPPNKQLYDIYSEEDSEVERQKGNIRGDIDARMDKPQLYESEIFQNAVELFIQEYGHEPATDSDFEGPGGVLEFMNMLQGDSSAAGAQNNVMRQMGEEVDAEGNEELRRE